MRAQELWRNRTPRLDAHTLLQPSGFATARPSSLHTWQVKLFGDPFLVKASVEDRLSDITARIQVKLQAKPEEFTAWKWSWHSNLAAPEELQVLIRS